MGTWQVFCIVSLTVLLTVTCAQQKTQKGPRGNTRSFTKKSDASFNGQDLPPNRRTYIKIKGQSGKFTLSKNSNPSADKNRIEISFEELGEVDSSLNPIGRTGSAKHYFNSFATLDFYFTDFQNGTYQDAVVDEMFFTADLPSVNARFIVTVLVFREDANITLDGESTEVKQGDVKLNFFIENWSFCDGTGSDNACVQGGNNQNGSYIKFVYSQKSKSRPEKSATNAKQRKTGGDEYGLGAGGVMIVSKKTEVDGLFEDMKAGYPKFEEQGGKHKFTFMFPRFASNVTYDPTYASSTDDTTATPNNNSGAEAGPVVMVTLMCASWLMVVTMMRMY